VKSKISDTIFDSDIVIATEHPSPTSIGAGASINHNAGLGTSASASTGDKSFAGTIQALPSLNLPPPPKQSADIGEPGRIQVQLITAEMARENARDALTDDSIPSKKVMAFDGAFVSGNTSLVCTISTYKNVLSTIK
jgi:hypothetical protein